MLSNTFFLKSYILRVKSRLLSYFQTRISVAHNYKILSPKFFYIICLNSVAFAIMADNFSFYELQKRFFRAIAFNFVATYAILYVCAFFSRIVANIALNAIFALTFAIGTINIFLILNFYSVINYAAVEVLLASNVREAREFIAMYANAKTLFALVAFGIFSALFCTNIFALPKKFALPRQITITLNPKFALGILALVLIASYAHKKDLANLGRKSEMLRVAEAIKYHRKLSKDFKDYRNFDAYLDAMVESKLAQNSANIGGGGTLIA
ncbi:phosphoethanolamine transferase domain-containing protein [Helicobacter sp. T3_23-1059]